MVCLANSCWRWSVVVRLLRDHCVFLATAGGGPEMMASHLPRGCSARGSDEDKIGLTDESV